MKALAIALSVALAGCSAIAKGPAGTQSTTRRPAVIEQANSSARSALASLYRWKAQPDEDCLSTLMRTARDELARLSGMQGGLAMLAENRSLSDYERIIHLRRHDEVALIRANVQLEMADGYLSRECLTEADGLYRDIIVDYGADRFEGIRQRAQIGIDDIRARRGSAP